MQSSGAKCYGSLFRKSENRLQVIKCKITKKSARREVKFTLSYQDFKL